ARRKQHEGELISRGVKPRVVFGPKVYEVEGVARYAVFLFQTAEETARPVRRGRVIGRGGGVENMHEDVTGALVLVERVSTRLVGEQVCCHADILVCTSESRREEECTIAECQQGLEECETLHCFCGSGDASQ